MFKLKHKIVCHKRNESIKIKLINSGNNKLATSVKVSIKLITDTKL